MALMEEISDRGLALPLGVGLVVAAVSAGPKLVKAGKPMIKGAIKGYLALHEKTKEMFAESSERMQDIYAEAKHEYEEESHVKAAGAEEEEAAAEEKPAEGAKRSKSKKKEEDED